MMHVPLSSLAVVVVGSCGGFELHLGQAHPAVTRTKLTDGIGQIANQLLRCIHPEFVHPVFELRSHPFELRSRISHGVQRVEYFHDPIA